MDKPSKILIIVVLILIALSVALSFYRSMVKRDYPVTTSETQPAV